MAIPVLEPTLCRSSMVSNIASDTDRVLNWYRCDMVPSAVFIVMLALCVLGMAALGTLLERRLLGACHRRCSVSYSLGGYGVLLGDGVKLSLKQYATISTSTITALVSLALMSSVGAGIMVVTEMDCDSLLGSLCLLSCIHLVIVMISVTTR
jgi:NADH:ubiquinone oxidoreductase subunit H